MDALLFDFISLQPMHHGVPRSMWHLSSTYNYQQHAQTYSRPSKHFSIQYSCILLSPLNSG